MADKDTLTLINAASKQELKLIQKAGFFQVENEVIIGDLYRDTAVPEVNILLVVRRTPLTPIDAVIPEVPHDRRVDDRLEETTPQEPIDPSKL